MIFVAVLTEIMFTAEKLYQGFLYGFAFGIGTIISPMLLLGALVSHVSKRLVSSRVTEVICGGLLILFGVYLLGRVFGY